MINTSENTQENTQVTLIKEELAKIPSGFYDKLNYPENEDLLLTFMKAQDKESYILFVKVWKETIKEIEALLRNHNKVEYHTYKPNIYRSVLAHNMYALRRAGKKWAREQYESVKK